MSEQENFESLVKQDKKLGQKVRDFFANFIDKIKNALKDISSRNAEYRALKNDVEAREKILAMFDECLKASDNTLNSDISYVAFAKIENNNVEELLNVLSNNYEMIKSSNNVFNINKEVISNNGNKVSENILQYFNSIGNIAYNSEFGNVELVKAGAKTTVTKGFSPKKASAVGAIKDVIEQGITIDRQSKWKGRDYDTAVIAGKGYLYGEPSIIGVVIKTYPKQHFNAKFYLHEIIEIKEADLYKQTAPQLSVDAEHKSTSANSISNSNENVKKSIKEQIDSKGNKLSEQQQKYFKDSKVRDENGNLLVVYHEASIDFANFSKRKKRTSWEF